MSDTIVIRADRLEEIEAFIEALNEWGGSAEARQQDLIEFLQSPIGLTQYLDRDTDPIIGHA